MADIPNRKYYALIADPNARPTYPPSFEDPRPPVTPITAGAGIGITLNDLVIGGVKKLIELSDVLDIPPYWQYNIVGDLDVDGLIDNEGEINLI
jgi:hypothetical protein